MQQYYISKDNARPNIDGLEEIERHLGFSIVPDQSFEISSQEALNLYHLAFQYGYIVNKAYLNFTYSEHNTNPQDYQGY